MSVRENWEEILGNYEDVLESCSEDTQYVFRKCVEKNLKVYETAFDEWECRYYEGQRAALFDVFLYLYFKRDVK